MTAAIRVPELRAFFDPYNDFLFGVAKGVRRRLIDDLRTEV
jgi:hypothetical protein